MRLFVGHTGHRQYGGSGMPSDDEVEHGKHLLSQGRLEEGESYLQDLMVTRKAGIWPNSRSLARVRLAYGVAQFAQNRPGDAAEVFAAGLRESERNRRGALFALSLRNLLSLALGLAGRFGEAEEQARWVARAYDVERSLASQRQFARFLLCYLLHARGQVREAVAAEDALLPDMARDLGAEHSLVYELRTHRAWCLAELGRFNEAESEGRALVSAATRMAAEKRSTSQFDHSAFNTLAFCLVETGRAREVEATIRGPLAEAEHSHGPYSLHAQTLRNGLATALVHQNRHAEALQMAELPAAWGCFDPGFRQLIRARALHGLGRFDECEATATHALAEATTALAGHHYRILEIRTFLAHLRNDRQEQHAVAAEWAQHFGLDHPRTVAARTHH